MIEDRQQEIPRQEIPKGNVPIRVVDESRVDLLQAIARPRFEIIPIEGVIEQARHLPHGARVTVTCSPALGVEKTLAVSEELAGIGLQAVPHVSARLVEGEWHLRRILQRLDEAGMQEVFVVGGDAKEPAGPFESAGELLQEMSTIEHGVRKVGITAYPESHPLIDDEALIEALRHKQRFASYMVTQICFDPARLANWLVEVRDRGVELPVYVGLPGVVEWKKLLSISMKIGIGDSVRFLKKQTNVASRLMKPGGYKPDELIDGVMPYLGDDRYKIAGFHINTFNQVETTEKWRARMLASLERSSRTGIVLGGRPLAAQYA